MLHYLNANKEAGHCSTVNVAVSDKEVALK